MNVVRAAWTGIYDEEKDDKEMHILFNCHQSCSM